MVGILIGVLVCSIVVYALCRPSREATQGDDEDTWRVLNPGRSTDQRMIMPVVPFVEGGSHIDLPLVD
jgi:hypothetical protein